MDAKDTLYVVWRRPRDSRERWQKIPGLEPMVHDAAFRATMAEEKMASFTDWEYALSPVGQSPQERRYSTGRQGAFYEGYRTKVMKPR